MHVIGSKGLSSKSDKATITNHGTKGGMENWMSEKPQNPALHFTIDEWIVENGCNFLERPSVYALETLLRRCACKRLIGQPTSGQSRALLRVSTSTHHDIFGHQITHSLA